MQSVHCIAETTLKIWRKYDRTSIGIGCDRIFYRFSFMYAKYFAVYFCRTINLMRELPTLYYIIYIVMLM